MSGIIYLHGKAADNTLIRQMTDVVERNGPVRLVNGMFRTTTASGRLRVRYLGWSLAGNFCVTYYFGVKTKMPRRPEQRVRIWL